MHVKLVGLTKKFYSLRGEVVAFDKINVEINDKEFFVLLGPSGCGKTTLLNLIAGLEKPTSGEIYFGDELVASRDKKIYLSPRERNTAFVFQSYALYPHLSVFENIAFPLRIIGAKVDAIGEAVMRAAKILEISELLPSKPKELSGGQRQRVAIARAIVRHPRLFLLDEPLSNLDAQLRVSMRAELKGLQRKLGITTIYVTHDQREAMSLGDRIAVLHNGRLQQVGSPKELYEEPTNIFVARFIGSPPMNFIKTPIIREAPDYFVMVGNKKLTLPREKAKRLQKLKGDTFLLGVRPEHISTVRAPSADHLAVEVISVEPLGKDTILHVKAEDNTFLIFGGDRDFKEGQIIHLAFNLTKSHIFEERLQ